MSDSQWNSSSPENEEISFIDLFAVLLQYKKMIIIITLIAAVGAVIFSILSLILPSEKNPLPNKYTPIALMLINENNASGGLSGMLSSSGLGGLASLAGVNTGSTTSNGQLALVLCETNSYLDNIIDKFSLIERYKVKKSVKTESRIVLKKTLSASLDDKTGVFSLSFTDMDPVFAEEVVNYATNLLENRFKDMGLDQNLLKKENLEIALKSSMDEILRLEQKLQDLETGYVGNSPNNIPRITLEYARLKREIEVQEIVYKQMRQEYEMLKITMESQSPIFQVIEYAEIPDKKSAPSRGLLCIIVVMAAFFASIFIAFILNSINDIKKDPGAMKKLKMPNAKKRQ